MTLNERIRRVPMPTRLRHRPISAEGYPIPAFVEYVDGKPDFRVMSGEHYARCIKHRMCWVCGQPLGKFMAFVIGPMCAVNRISAEPPSHYDCAMYSVHACPFLTQPRMRRNEKDLPGEGKEVGVMLKHNPGVTLIWVTQGYRVFREGQGVLCEIGDPVSIEFYREGRRATLDEVLASMDIGLPKLRAVAERQGRKAVERLEQQVSAAMKLVREVA